MKPGHLFKKGSSIIIAPLLASVVACGGGSSNNDQVTSPPATPPPSTSPPPVNNAPQPERIRLNQYGFAPNAPKGATLVSDSETPVNWQLLNDADEAVSSGSSRVIGSDRASGESVHAIDFSSYQTTGNYRLNVDGVGERNVNIAPGLYTQLHLDAARFFHFHRMGQPLHAEHLSNPAHARQAIHPADESLPCLNDWCGEGVRLNVRHSWYDAGDFGAYPVNVAISSWTLLNAYEFAALDYSSLALNIPESNDAIPDLLDEVRFGSTFMAGMLPPEGQLASHKIHNVQWSGFEGDLDLENAMPRFAQPPSTAATFAIARNAAHLARVFRALDAEFAQQQWQLAIDAWQRAESNSVVLYTSETADSVGGGDYEDSNIIDDRYAAAVEMWISAAELQLPQREFFAQQVRNSASFLQFDPDGAQQWQQVQGSGSLSLWLHRTLVELTEDEIATLRTRIVATADTARNTLELSGYPMVYNPSSIEPEQTWPWGSNSFVLNRMILLGYAHKITQDAQYLTAMHRGMDYLLGNNPMNLSYITGYGEFVTEDLHDRIAYPLLRDQGIAFPPGWVAGGPLTGWPGCDNATPESGAPAKRYAPQGTATDAWCSKEVAINWNSPLVWVTAYLSANPLN